MTTWKKMSDDQLKRVLAVLDPEHVDEVLEELEGRRASYRGPGVYRFQGRDQVAYGSAIDEGALLNEGALRNTFVIFARPEEYSPRAEFTAIPLDVVNSYEDNGERLFTYVGESSEAAPSSNGAGPALEDLPEVAKEPAPAGVVVGAIWRKVRAGRPGGDAIITEVSHYENGKGYVSFDRSAWRYEDGTPWSGANAKVAFATLISNKHDWEFVGYVNDVHSVTAWVLQALETSSSTRQQLHKRAEGLVANGKPVSISTISTAVSKYLSSRFNWATEDDNGIIYITEGGKRELDRRRMIVKTLHDAGPCSIPKLVEELFERYGYRDSKASRNTLASSLASLVSANCVKREGQVWSTTEEMSREVREWESSEN